MNLMLLVHVLCSKELHEAEILDNLDEDNDVQTIDRDYFPVDDDDEYDEGKCRIYWINVT